jgi:hypothetical protein
LPEQIFFQLLHYLPGSLLKGDVNVQAKAVSIGHVSLAEDLRVLLVMGHLRSIVNYRTGQVCLYLVVAVDDLCPRTAGQVVGPGGCT